MRDGSQGDLSAEAGFVGYRCYLIGLDGTIEHHQELNATDDILAANAAQAVLDRSAYFWAELWFLDRRIFQLTKRTAC
jgi:hypothetical protein